MHDRFKCVADALRFMIHVGVKQRLGDDRERQPHHFGVNVTFVAALLHSAARLDAYRTIVSAYVAMRAR